MISSFGDREAERIYRGLYSKVLPRDIQRRAFNRLRVLDAIVRIDELLNPPSNRLEALRGDMSGLYSIRINQQWRICFRWENGNACDVSIRDYH